jgi:hypothetical protein
MSTFTKLAEMNCKEHVEKKNGFSYLSWPWAVRKLRETAPEATWEVRRFDGLPYLKTECGFFVEVAVTVDGVTLSQIHPVLDHRNQPITAPNSFHINTSIQRCLVKAISLHGLGLYVYAGEDLPEATSEPSNGSNGAQPETAASGRGVCQDALNQLPASEQIELRSYAEEVRGKLAVETADDAMSLLESFGLDSDRKVAIWSLFDSKERAALKKAGKRNPASTF